MRTYVLKVLIAQGQGMPWAGMPVVKEYQVRANSFAMAAGLCRGQAAVNGWKIFDVINYDCK